MASLDGPVSTGKGESYMLRWRDADGQQRKRRVYGSRRAASPGVSVGACHGVGDHGMRRRGFVAGRGAGAGPGSP